MRVVFVGPPGSGKGTQADLLQSRLGLTKIGTGETLRAAVTEGTEVGKRVKPYMDAGQLAPDSLVNDLVGEWLRRPDAPENFLLDGYPRNVGQARALDAVLRELNRPLNAVIIFQADDEVVVKRMLTRQRSDDTEETARVRVKFYRDAARELIGHYRGQKLVHTINAGWPVEHVYAKIAGLLLPKDC